MKTENKTWAQLLGYDPSHELKVKILEQVQSEGINLAEVCRRYMLPPLVIVDEDGKFEDENGEKVTAEEWRSNPAHKHTTLIMVSWQANQEK